MNSVAVVTSTIGRKTLKNCIDSVKNQTRRATHYVFIHGKSYINAKNEVVAISAELDADVVFVQLPFNNGGKGFGMAPVYAAAPYIVAEEVICYLDDDNLFDPDHVEKNVGFMEEENLDWCYSLRRIIDQAGNYICDDLTESLGIYNNCHGTRLVDNSCYVVKTKIAQKHGHSWMYPVISDRAFLLELMTNKLKCGGLGETTVSYRISEDGSNPDGARYFLRWNEVQKTKYKGVYPWMQRTVYQT